MIRGSTMITIVSAPERRDMPQCSAVTKNSIPNRPYTMDGIPESVSAVIRISFTKRLPFFAYSTRKIAAKIPTGAAIARDTSVMIRVLISDGRRETFSEV